MHLRKSRGAGPQGPIHRFKYSSHILKAKEMMLFTLRGISKNPKYPFTVILVIYATKKVQATSGLYLKKKPTKNNRLFSPVWVENLDPVFHIVHWTQAGWGAAFPSRISTVSSPGNDGSLGFN